MDLFCALELKEGILQVDIEEHTLFRGRSYLVVSILSVGLEES